MRIKKSESRKVEKFDVNRIVTIISLLIIHTPTV